MKRQMPKFWGGFLLVLSLFILSGPLPEAKAASRLAKKRAAQNAPQVDHLSMAALLIQDGFYDRALVILDGVDPQSLEADALPRYHALEGLAHLKLEHNEDALSALGAAQAAGHGDPLLYIYRAQAQIGLQDYHGAKASLEAGGDALHHLEGVWLLLARCHWELQSFDGAWAALEAGAARFPHEPEFIKQQVFLLIDLGLFQRALELGEVYLASVTPTPDAYVAFAEALRRSHAFERAEILLEAARLRFPEAIEIYKQLAYTYLDGGKPRSAGWILELATQLDEDLAQEAAECYRQGGAFTKAFYMNAQVPDAQKKAKQRLGLLLETHQYERAAALDSRLKRLELLDDDSTKYALAYAYFQLGDYAASQNALVGIGDEKVFQQAIALRQAIEACQNGAQGCQ